MLSGVYIYMCVDIFVYSKVEKEKGLGFGMRKMNVSDDYCMQRQVRV